MKNEVATNQFTGGLMLDANPLTTPNTVLTQCLNGTLLTFNGNENILQNDMGNARVETAMLPEGYIPLGTCSHGGFIYIVSYNPFKNLAQVGSFPSPERNIDTTELNNAAQTLTDKDFYIEGDSLLGYHPLKPLIRKVFDEVKLNPGDKFIVFAKDLFGEHLSDFGITNNKIDSVPRLWKLRIASIQDNKTTELENLKWYNTGVEKEQGKQNPEDIGEGNYYVKRIESDLSERQEGTVDIDEYRSLVNGAYSVFSSKKSGKISLLISPEYPETFSATWSAYASAEDEKNSEIKIDGTTIPAKTFSIFINSSWNNNGRDVNPEGIFVRFKNPKGLMRFTNSFRKEGDYYVKQIRFDLSRNQSADETKYRQIILASTEGDEIRYTAKETSDGYLPLRERIKKESWYPILEKDIKEKKTFLNNKYIHRIFNNSFPSTEQAQSLYYVSIDWKYNPDTSEWEGDKTDAETSNVTTIYELTEDYYKGKIYDDHLNNYFNTDVPYLLSGITIPENITLGDPDYVMEVEVFPYTEAGYFPHLKKTLKIDLSSLNKEQVKINSYKYWVTEDTETINWSLDAYTELTKPISKVWLEFYDNNGLVATQVLDGLNSYNGDFSTSIDLGRSSLYNGIKNTDIDGNLIRHPGLPIDILNQSPNEVLATLNEIFKYNLTIEQLKETAWETKTPEQMIERILEEYYNLGYLYKSKNGELIGEVKNTENVIIHKYVLLNDSGIIHPNGLYGIKFKYKVRPLSTFGQEESEEKLFAKRWLWTCPIFNEKYDSTDDFDQLPAELTLDFNTYYGSTGSYEAKQKNVFLGHDTEETKITDYSKQLGANIQVIDSKDGKDNIESKTVVSLTNNYNTFRLLSEKLENIKVTCYFDDQQLSSFTKSIPQPQIIQEEIAGNAEALLKTEEEIPEGDINTNLENIDSLENKNNQCSLYLNGEDDTTVLNEISILTGQPLNKPITYRAQWVPQDGIVTNEFTFKAIHYSKYYRTGENQQHVQMHVCRTPVLSEQDLHLYNLQQVDNKVLFNKYVYMIVESEGAGKHYYHYLNSNYVQYDSNSKKFILSNDSVSKNKGGGNAITLKKMYTDSASNVSEICNEHNLFLPVLTGGSSDGRSSYRSMKVKLVQAYNSLIDYVRNGEYRIATDDTEIKEWSNKKTLKLDTKNTGGFLGVVADDKFICDFGHPVSSSENRSVSSRPNINGIPYYGSTFTFWAKLVLGILTQLYYRTDETVPKDLYVFDNYTYYEPHNSDFIADIIYNIKNTSSEVNEMIGLGSYNLDIEDTAPRYSDYLEEISTTMNPTGEISTNNANVNFVLRETTKHCPLQLQFNYIQPDTYKIDFNNTCIVQSLNHRVNNNLVSNCEKGVMYTVNEDNEFFPLNDKSEFTPVEYIKEYSPETGGIVQVEETTTERGSFSYLPKEADSLILKYNDTKWEARSLYKFTLPELSNSLFKIEDNILKVNYRAQGLENMLLETYVMTGKGNSGAECNIYDVTSFKFFEFVSEENNLQKNYIRDWQIGTVWT